MASQAGRVKLKLLRGQGVSIGDEVAIINPTSLSVQAQLPVENLYRLGQIPPTATVTIKTALPRLVAPICVF